MRVLCIKNGPWRINDNGTISKGANPKYGEVCDVLNTKEVDGLRYELKGYFGLYNAKQFIPLSDIDETELAEQRK